MRLRGPDVRRMIRAAGAELDRFCEEWIGWTLPSVARVIEESNWSPTPRSSYCHRCGQTVGEGEASAKGCSACRSRHISTDGVVRLGSYSEHLRQWILGVKYRRWSEMGRHLGAELGRAIAAAGVVDLPKAVVVPMPMPWLRRTYRGIDHAEVIGSAAARELDVPTARILVKANGPTQLRVPKSARRVNARQGMRIRRRWDGWPLKGLHIVLVDDVRTTGSSMAAAARLLRPLGPERVVEATLAVAEPGRRGIESASDDPEQVRAA